MKKSLLISAFVLIGLTLGVAANSYRPPTPVEKDVGVTKETKCSFPNDALAITNCYLPEVGIAVQVDAPAAAYMHENTIAVNIHAIDIAPRPPSLAIRCWVESNSNYWREYGTSEKLYLINQSLRLCMRDATSVASSRTDHPSA
jgi:hypothetical protein